MIQKASKHCSMPTFKQKGCQPDFCCNIRKMPHLRPTGRTLHAPLWCAEAPGWGGRTSLGQARRRRRLITLSPRDRRLGNGQGIVAAARQAIPKKHQSQFILRLWGARRGKECRTNSGRFFGIVSETRAESAPQQDVERRLFRRPEGNRAGTTEPAFSLRLDPFTRSGYSRRPSCSQAPVRPPRPTPRLPPFPAPRPAQAICRPSHATGET